MKIAIMQPYFFPYIGYWQLLNAVDKYVIYDDVKYIKGGWINRNRILMNGEGKFINLLMHGASSNKLINEIEALENAIYSKKLLKTLEGCYKKAPYYSDVIQVIEDVINQNGTSLSHYLEFSIRQVCKYLSINTEIIVSSSIKKNNALKGQGKVIEICKILGADEYINAIGGQSLYSHEDFTTNGVRLRFLKTADISYQQFKNEFIPNLSIIDVMMFNSPMEVKKMLNNFELI